MTDEGASGMAVDLAIELDEQLIECKTALQNQAQEMLSILFQFEERLKARLDAAEARLAALRSESESALLRPELVARQTD
jgi:hypothetical protein